MSDTMNQPARYIVTGPLATSKNVYDNARAAYRAVDRLDNKYGAYRHSVTRA